MIKGDRPPLFYDETGAIQEICEISEACADMRESLLKQMKDYVPKVFIMDSTPLFNIGDHRHITTEALVAALSNVSPIKATFASDVPDMNMSIMDKSIELIDFPRYSSYSIGQLEQDCARETIISTREKYEAEKREPNPFPMFGKNPNDVFGKKKRRK